MSAKMKKPTDYYVQTIFAVIAPNGNVMDYKHHRENAERMAKALNKVALVALNVKFKVKPIQPRSGGRKDGGK
jgi:hypothetical protein